MIEGESGIMARSHPDNRPLYIVSRRELRWPSGQIAKIYSADEPDQLRGPQHERAWADELAAWSSFEAWDDLLMGLRLGPKPQVVVTTTPRRLKILRDLRAQATTVVTQGRTVENRANLSAKFLAVMDERYGGTRLGRQELEGELLDELEGALWSQSLIDACQWKGPTPELKRVIVGVDPSITSKRSSDETGIVAAGLGVDEDIYVLRDDSCRARPAQWAERVRATCKDVGATAVVLETNRGGETCEEVLRAAFGDCPIRVITLNSQQGKAGRAEPVSALYEKGRVRHVPGLTHLEDEMVSWQPQVARVSPNRIDALVFAVNELLPGSTIWRPELSAVAEIEASAYRVERHGSWSGYEVQRQRRHW